jgi:hypothetical protein
VDLPPLRRPTLWEAPGYWLAGQRVPVLFRPWLASRVQRNDYRIILRRRTLGTMAYVCVLSGLSRSGIGAAVVILGIGMGFFVVLRAKEPSAEEKRRLLAWHGVTPTGGIREPDYAALSGPLTWDNRWQVLAWATALPVTAYLIHEITGLRFW